MKKMEICHISHSPDQKSEHYTYVRARTHARTYARTHARTHTHFLSLYDTKDSQLVIPGNLYLILMIADADRTDYNCITS